MPPAYRMEKNFNNAFPPFLRAVKLVFDEAHLLPDEALDNRGSRGSARWMRLNDRVPGVLHRQGQRVCVSCRSVSARSTRRLEHTKIGLGGTFAHESLEPRPKCPLSLSFEGQPNRKASPLDYLDMFAKPAFFSLTEALLRKTETIDRRQSRWPLGEVKPSRSPMVLRRGGTGQHTVVFFLGTRSRWMSPRRGRCSRPATQSVVDRLVTRDHHHPRSSSQQGRPLLEQSAAHMYVPLRQMQGMRERG